MEALEYAIRKDVRNNPIIREVDRARLRDMWRSAALAAVVVTGVLYFAWQHFELLRHGYQIERVKAERASEEQVGRHLRIAVESLRSPERIEKLATEQLHLVAPGPGDTVVIERVVPSAPPASSLVARR